MTLKVALTCRVSQETAYKETRDALSVEWTALCDALTWTPVMVPNRLRDPKRFLSSIGVDAIVLTGGNTVGSACAPNAPGTVAEREATERALLDHAVQSKVPVLGVCRGLQVINRFFGGDITHGIATGVAHVGASHTVDLASQAWADLAGASRLQVNSFHDDGVLGSQVAPDLVVTAKSSEDGVVEGLAHRALPIVGVQWHPERPSPCETFDRALFRSLFETRGALSVCWGET